MWLLYCKLVGFNGNTNPFSPKGDPESIPDDSSRWVPPQSMRPRLFCDSPGRRSWSEGCVIWISLIVAVPLCSSVFLVMRL